MDGEFSKFKFQLFHLHKLKYQYQSSENHSVHYGFALQPTLIARFFDVWTATHQFTDGASWIWHHHDFRLQQDRAQEQLCLEYGNFPPEMMEVEDPEFMV